MPVNCYLQHFFVDSTKEMGANYMLSGRLLIRKCLKGQFKIVSFLSCLLCVDTTLVHPFSYIALLFNCENSTKTGLKMSIKQLMSKENSQRPSKSSKNVFPRKNQKLARMCISWKQIIKKLWVVKDSTVHPCNVRL